MQQAFAESIHGGPDAQGAPQHDFSTNANACGPCEITVAALSRADASRYPDPQYTQLRAQLAEFHHVDANRIVMAASASEFMHRISAWAARWGVEQVVVPLHGYGDYSRAAQIANLQPAHAGSTKPSLHWACEPASPLGTQDEAIARWQADASNALDIRVLDCAYVPLRLDGQAPRLPSSAWQLWTPNKALALTGVRAAYAIAPAHVPDAQIAQLRAMAASWPVGVHGVAMLQSWMDPAVQQWLADTLVTLKMWKASQMALCRALGWQVVDGSLANYFTARLPDGCDIDAALKALRRSGIKLRDCTSFGLPLHVRLGVLSPASQQALADQWKQGNLK